MPWLTKEQYQAAFRGFLCDIRRKVSVYINSEQESHPSSHIQVMELIEWPGFYSPHATGTAEMVLDAMNETTADFYPYQVEVDDPLLDEDQIRAFFDEHDIRGTAIGLSSRLASDDFNQCVVMYFSNERDAVLTRCMFG